MVNVYVKFYPNRYISVFIRYIPVKPDYHPSPLHQNVPYNYTANRFFSFHGLVQNIFW